MVKLNTSAFKNVWTYKVMRHINESNCDAFVSEEGIKFGEQVRVRGECDEKGRINKICFNYDNGRTDSQIFKYNENGDIIQAIFDFRDDGDYESITEYKCEYDKNNELVSQIGTTALDKPCKPGFKESMDSIIQFLRFWPDVISGFINYYKIL